jgi:uncharacterized protein YdgA (DUF945 family)
MKKVLLALLLVLIVGFVVLEQTSASRAEAEYRALLAELSARPDVLILESQFRRGLLSSTASTAFELHALEGGPGALAHALAVAFGSGNAPTRLGLRVHHEVDHGSQPLVDWIFGGFAGMPVVAVVRTRVELDNETQTELAGAPDRFPPLAIETALRASGVRESSVDLPAFRLVRSDAERALEARFKGLGGSLVSTGAFGDFAGSFQSPGLVVKGSTGGLRVEDLAWVVDFGRESNGLPVGETVARLGLFEMRSASAPEPQLLVSNLEIEQANEVKQGALEASLEGRLERMDVAGRRIGPGKLSLALHRVDAKSAARLRAALRGSPASTPAAAATPGDAPEVDPADALAALPAAALLEVLPALAARSPELELAELRIGTPEGEITASARLGIDGSRPELLQSPLTLPAAFQASFEISVPAALVDALAPAAPSAPAGPGAEGGMESGTQGEAPAAQPLPPIADLRQRGLVILDAARYRSRGEWREARFTVNGLPVAVGELLAPLAGSAFESPISASRSRP